jgi:hypothetical protein
MDNVFLPQNFLTQQTYHLLLLMISKKKNFMDLILEKNLSDDAAAVTRENII